MSKQIYGFTPQKHDKQYVAYTAVHAEINGDFRLTVRSEDDTGQKIGEIVIPKSEAVALANNILANA